jgi:hypothetical protein
VAGRATNRISTDIMNNPLNSPLQGGGGLQMRQGAKKFQKVRLLADA